MNFDFTEDQREIRRTARELLAARYPPAQIRAIALDGAPDEHWDEIAGLGWPELALGDGSEDGFGIVELAVVAEELGYALAPSPLASTWAAALLLGGEEVRRGTVAMVDDEADPVRLGDDERLSGTKIVVPDAVGAELLAVTVGERVFVVAAADVSIEPAQALDATRPLSTVRLAGAPAVELHGDLQRGWLAIAVVAAAEAVGVATRVTEMTVAYVKARKQFGRAVGSYQAVSHVCAQMLLETECARSLTYWAAWALDSDPTAAPTAAHAAKAAASEAAQRVTRSALQLHGGIGFTFEHDLHLFLKRAEAGAHAFGDPRWHRARLVDLLL